MSARLLAHEWLAEHGGSENVFEQMLRALSPQRTVCLWNDAPQRFTSRVEETWLARTPLRRSKAAALPFMAHAWKQVPLGDVDSVVVSSHAMAHHLAARAAAEGMPAWCYTHTPPRYLWTPDLDPRGQGRVQGLLAERLRRVDRSATNSRVQYIANSHYISQRIADTWGQESIVLHPPADIAKWQAAAQEDAAVSEMPTGDFVLGASRFVEYKRLDLTIRVGELLGLPVVLSGSGPQEEELRAIAADARVPVTFVIRPTDAALATLYRSAALFVFLGIEDFGIMPVEAMSLGTPALTYAEGGASESVLAVKGGATSRSYDDLELRAGAAAAMTVDMVAASEAVQRFSNESFREQLREIVEA